MNAISKILVISFIVGVTAPTGLFHFLSGIPEIVAHYDHHNREHGQMSFATFLLDHAMHEDHSDYKHPEHDDFPFHHHHSSSCCSTLLTFIPAEHPFYEFTFLKRETQARKKILIEQQCCLSGFASSIWQPPQA